MTPDQQFELIKRLLLLIGGGLIGLATSLVIYWLEGKREQRHLRLEGEREREQERKQWDTESPGVGCHRAQGQPAPSRLAGS